MTPKDVGILFRTKDSHQDFEKALERQRIPSYVYKGLGFFEADEIKDVLALLRYLAAPESNLRAAALLRSRFVRLSDPALQALAPNLASALSARTVDLTALDREDRLVLERARQSVGRWLGLVDRLPPAEVLELVLDETAYAFETRGPRVRQARENLKKIRAMIRRVQNRGYATMSRLAEHLERLTAGDESNAVIDAGDSVSLMTIHAAKGLEFPVVFRREPQPGHRRPPPCDSRRVRCRKRGSMAERRRLSVGSRRRREGQRPRGNEASALRGADARARSPVSRLRGEGRAMARVRRQPGRHPAGRYQGTLRSRQPLAGARDDGMDGGLRARPHVQSLCRRPPGSDPRLYENRKCDDRPIADDPPTTSLHSSIRSSCPESPSREPSHPRSRGGAAIRSTQAAAA